MATNDHPRINVRINQAENKKFRWLKEHGYSAREILELALHAKGCENTITIISKKTDEQIQFNRNILSKRQSL